jgi:hypothetical protein
LQVLLSFLEHIINVSETDASEKFPPGRFDIVYISMIDEVDTDIKQVFIIAYRLIPIYLLFFSILIVQISCYIVII